MKRFGYPLLIFVFIFVISALFSRVYAKDYSIESAHFDVQLNADGNSAKEFVQGQ